MQQRAEEAASLSWVVRCYVPGCVRGIFLSWEENYPLLFYYCVSLGSYTYFYIFDWSNKRPFIPLSLSFPHCPRVIKIISEGILSGDCSCPFPNRAVRETVSFPQRRGKAPYAAPKDSGKELEGSGRSGVPMGSALPAAPCPAAPQTRGTLWRPISHPDRTFLSSASFPRRSPLVCASPASSEALMPGLCHFYYLG